jgi:hypothetical protein
MHCERTNRPDQIAETILQKRVTCSALVCPASWMPQLNRDKRCFFPVKVCARGGGGEHL